MLLLLFSMQVQLYRDSSIFNYIATRSIHFHLNICMFQCFYHVSNSLQLKQSKISFFHNFDGFFFFFSICKTKSMNRIHINTLHLYIKYVYKYIIVRFEISFSVFIFYAIRIDSDDDEWWCMNSTFSISAESYQQQFHFAVNSVSALSIDRFPLFIAD